MDLLNLKAIPRSIWLDKSEKQLVQWPIMEIEKLRGNRVDIPSSVLKGGSMLEISSVTAAQVRENSNFTELLYRILVHCDIFKTMHHLKWFNLKILNSNLVQMYFSFFF